MSPESKTESPKDMPMTLPSPKNLGDSPENFYHFGRVERIKPPPIFIPPSINQIEANASLSARSSSSMSGYRERLNNIRGIPTKFKNGSGYARPDKRARVGPGPKSASSERMPRSRPSKVASPKSPKARVVKTPQSPDDLTMSERGKLKATDKALYTKLYTLKTRATLPGEKRAATRRFKAFVKKHHQKQR